MKAHTSLYKTKKGFYSSTNRYLLLTYKNLNIDKQTLVEKLIYGKLLYHSSTQKALNSKVENYTIQRKDKDYTCLLCLKQSISKMSINNLNIHNVRPRCYTIENHDQVRNALRKGDGVESNKPNKVENKIETEKVKKEQGRSKIISIERRKSVNHVNKNSEELSLRKDLEALLEANYEVMNRIKEIQSRLN